MRHVQPSRKKVGGALFLEKGEGPGNWEKPFVSSRNGIKKKKTWGKRGQKIKQTRKGLFAD